MTISTMLWPHREALVASFQTALIHGVLNTWRNCEDLKTTPQEPDFVAGLVLDSAPHIYYALNAVLAPRRVSVSVFAVFCHQTPQVEFHAPHRAACELGDILFAYVHSTTSGRQKRNALLFQAKASASQPYHVHGKELDQLQLYEAWPDFEYVRSAALTGRKRTVTPKAPHAGAQYLLIDDRPPAEPMSGLLGFPNTYPIGCCMPDAFLHDHSPLASELFALFTFRTGRPFENRQAAGQEQGWSQVVWDLLETGMTRVFNRKNSGRRAVPRGAGGPSHLFDGMSLAFASSAESTRLAAELLGRSQAAYVYSQGRDIPPSDDQGSRGTDAPESGVSVVLIETAEPDAAEG